jgi:hypothetical protein
MESNRNRWKGSIQIYRFTAPPDHPGSILKLPVGKIGDSIEVKF